MEQKVALFEEYKSLTNRPWFVIDLEKTTKEALQVLVNKTKIKLGIAVLPAPPLAPKLKHFGFAPEAFAQRFDPENAPHFNQETGKGGAANAGMQVAIRNINGGGKGKRLSQTEIQKLEALEPEILPLSKRKREEYRLIRTAGLEFLVLGHYNENNHPKNKNAAQEGARKYLEEEVKKSIATGKIDLEENETAESIVNNLLEEVMIDAESKIQEKEKVRKGSENVLKGGLNKLPKYQRKSKFNELFTQKFGHGPTNHVANGIINQHNVHAGSSGRKTRKNKY